MRFPTTRRWSPPRWAAAAARKPRRAREPIRVSVVHDNLVWARWPVLVGHYRDDVFVGAEDFLDRQLKGRLRELQRLDLYPGAYNTSAVVLNERRAQHERRSTPGRSSRAWERSAN